MKEFEDPFGYGLIHIDHLTDEQVAMVAKMFDKEEGG
jgi:hypothetical protein